MRRYIPIAWAIFSIASPSISAQKLSREEWGAPLVVVSHEAPTWTIRGQKQVVTFSESDLALRAESGSTIWEMVPSEADDLLLKSDGEEAAYRLADARRIKIVRYDTGFKTGVRITLSDWRRPKVDALEAGLDLTLHLTVALEGPDEDLVFDIAAEEGDAVVRRLDWPTALKADDVDYTVLSNIRGVLLPRDWPKAYHPIRSSNLDGSDPDGDTSEVQSNVIECWSMPWWGFKKGAAAMMVIVETPDDAAYQFSHPAGGPTVIGPRWRRSSEGWAICEPRGCAFCRKAITSIWPSAIDDTQWRRVCSCRSRKRSPEHRSSPS